MKKIAAFFLSVCMMFCGFGFSQATYEEYDEGYAKGYEDACMGVWDEWPDYGSEDFKIGYADGQGERQDEIDAGMDEDE